MGFRYLLFRHALSQPTDAHLVAHRPKVFKNEGGNARAENGRGIKRKVPANNLDFLSPKLWHRDEQEHSEHQRRDQDHAVSSSKIHSMFGLTVTISMTARSTPP